MEKFYLNDLFVDGYRNVKPSFGFNGLGYVVYKRTYSRRKPDGSFESWVDTVERVVNGLFSVRKTHFLENGLSYDEGAETELAEKMFDHIFNFRFLPAGRSLWALGTPIIEEKGLYAALYNCSFRSTKNKIYEVLPLIMDELMLGVGVGTDLAGSHQEVLDEDIIQSKERKTFVIPDSREGWVEAFRKSLATWFVPSEPYWEFDYSQIRPAGSPIKTFGGVAAGHKPLKKLLDFVVEVLSKRTGKQIGKRALADIINMTGVAVVSGNVRRSAIIILDEHSVYQESELLELKDFERYPERAEYAWTSNNSLIITPDKDRGFYEDIFREYVVKNGEPGFIFLKNAQRFGRTGDMLQDSDVVGVNPCGEIFLADSEHCNLVDIFLPRIADREEFFDVIQSAYLFAKTISLLPPQYPDSRAIMLANRRLGISVSGIVQKLSQISEDELVWLLQDGYEYIRELDKEESKKLCVRESIKVTTIKPSGTLSLLAGSSAGIHAPRSKYYIRRVRIAKDNELIPYLQRAGYKVEPAQESPDTTFVVEFPIEIEAAQYADTQSALEQLELARRLQFAWSDNSISITVSFWPHEIPEIARWLEAHQTVVKALSFLPRRDDYTGYAQLPEEAISEKEYRQMIATINMAELLKANNNDGGGEEAKDLYCTTDVCLLE